MRHRWVHLGMAGALLFAAGSPAARAETFKDEKLGYSFAYPGRWNQVPVDPGTTVAARFDSNREYEWTDVRNNFWRRHRPYLQVVVIPLSAKDAKGATVEKTAEGVKVQRRIPWTNLKEYLDQTCTRIGGFYYSAEDEATVNGLKVRRYEITVDKNVEGPRRVFGWEFAAEDAYYGLVAEVLVQEEKKLKQELFASFATFRVFPRTGKLPTATDSDEEIVIKDPKKEETREVSPEELKKRRDDAFQSHLSRIRGSLPQGWAILESPNFAAVSHTDARFTREVLAQAEALRTWLEKELGFVGTGHAGRVVLRIFADFQEYQSFQEARGWRFDQPEATTYRERDGWSNSNLQWLNRRVYDLWLRDKNDQLFGNLPRWIDWGLGDFIEGARMKSGRLEFRADFWENREMAILRRSDSLYRPKDFFSLTSDELWAANGASAQTQFFVNFLLAGPARSSARFKGVLGDYLRNLIFLLDSENTSAAADEKPPQNEKEEEEMIRKRQEQWRLQERKVLDQLFAKTFAGWTEKDWDAFNALYRASLK